MQISSEELRQQAAKTLFQPYVLEKVWRLMSILELINKDSFLESRLALKGGTALNLFLFQLPRLSVDIDLNYIGSHDKEIMQQERLVIENILEAIFIREGLSVLHVPNRHAGGKWRLKYPSTLGNHGNLEVDLNFLLRVPLWDTHKVQSHTVGGRLVPNARLMSPNDLIGGKIAALFARDAARDLFDVYHLFTSRQFDKEKVRLASILYGTMSTVDWRKMSATTFSYDPDEIKRLLIPLLKKDESSIQLWTKNMDSVLETCRNGFISSLLPLTSSEMAFLDLFHDKGIIDSSLLTNDPLLRDRIERLPGLLWKLQTLARSA